jgi:hypothetical protein
MTTKRTPIVRYPGAREITPEAAALFREMEALLPCTCIWGPNYYDRQECASCDQWWELHRRLYDALGFRQPWKWPLVDCYAVDDPPHDEIAGGRIHQRMTPRIHCAAEWDKNGEFFNRLRRAAKLQAA